MKLVNTVDNTELDAKKYPMPTKGTAGTVKINGEDVVTMSTSGRGNKYTYFRIKNVDLYVAGELAADVEYTLELPEGFGSETPPAARKSYYVRKRPQKLNEDGSIPAGEGSAPGADAQAAHTDAQTGESVVPQGDENDPAGNAIEESVADLPSEAPRKRSRK